MTPSVTKAPGALRTIREVADELGLEPYVLRFWEKEFKQIQPTQRSNGRRYYRPEDIETIKQVQSLLHDQGYTIKGARAVLEDKPEEPVEPFLPNDNWQHELNEVATHLSQMRERIASYLL